MYYNDEYYKEIDETVGFAIRETLRTGWTFIKTLGITIAMMIAYLVLTPIRIYEYISDIIEFAKLEEKNEQIRFNEWRNTGKIR